jgi:hypothetical protein
MMIEHRKGEVILVVLTVDGIEAEVVESIVHPPHVPLEGETQTTQVRRASHLWPGSRLLRDGHDPGEFGVGNVVKASQKLDRFKVLPTSVLVGDPFALLS